MPLKDPEARRAYRQQHYAANRAKILEKARLYRLENLEKISERDRVYFKTHKREICTRVQIYYQEHRQERLSYAREYATEHGDKIRAYLITYKTQHPEYIRLKSSRRRALEANAPISDLTAQDWQDIKEHYGHRCVYCGKKPQRLTMDHITPLVNGGSHTKSNIVPACKNCNSKKGRGKPLCQVQPLLL